MSKHGGTERFIIDLFKQNEEFIFEKRKYKILKLGKPKPSKGECKTDVYVLAVDVENNSIKEIKISIKQSNADFLENKISLERATEIFGTDVKDILVKSINSVKESFTKDYLVYFKKHKRTGSKCIKIGWRFELLNKHGGERSGKILLSNRQKIDVYSGSNLNKDKKDSKVKGEIINNSGIANYILEVHDHVSNLNYYLDLMIPIQEFAIKQDIYFACKAVNFRVDEDKWEGNRPLSVFINWYLSDGILKAEFVMDQPLEKKANEFGANIRNILKEIKINSRNFHLLERFLDENIVSCK